MTNRSITEMRTQVDSLINEMGIGVTDESHKALVENYRNAFAAMLALEDRWMTPLWGMLEDQDFIALKDIKDYAKMSRTKSNTNPLLRRGKSIKTDHVIGEGLWYIFGDKKQSDLPPRFRKVLESQVNKSSVFSASALKRINYEVFATGNAYILYNTDRQEYFPVPLGKIQGFVSYPEEISRVKYYIWESVERDDLNNGTSKPQLYLVPTDTYAETDSYRAARDESLKIDGEKIKIRRDLRIIDFAPNREIGQVFGLPDNIAALPPAEAYSTFIKSGVKYIDAISSIAFQVKMKTTNGQKAAEAQLARNRAGGRAVTGPDTEISQMPGMRTADLYTGRPIAAQVAAALDVSVSVLTSEVVAGGYASEQALTPSERSAAINRRNDFSEFMERIFRVGGFPGGELRFLTISSEPSYRIGQHAAVARQLGALNQREYRELELRLLDIEGDPNDLPKPDEWTGSKASTLPEWMGDNPDAPSGDPVPRQGNSGTAGSMNDGNQSQYDDRDSAQ